MTPTERERIEKEAKEYANPWTPPNSNRRVAVDSYIAGATAEHDKVRNQAIDDCIAHVHGYCNATTADTLVKKLEQLKTKP